MRSAQELLSWMVKNNYRDLLPDCIALISCILVCALCNTALPLLFKGVIDQISTEVLFTNALAYCLLLYTGWYLFNELLEGLRFFLFIRLLQKSQSIVANKIFRQLHKFPYQFYSDNRVGDITTTVKEGIDALATLLRLFLLFLTPLVIELTSAFVLLALSYSYLNSLVVTATFLLYIGTHYAGNKFVDQYRKKVRDLSIKTSGFFADTLLNYTTIKFASREEEISQRYYIATQNIKKGVSNINNRNILIAWAGSLIISMGLLSILFFTAKGLSQDHFTLGDFVIVHIYFIRFVNPLQRSDLAYRNYKEGKNKLETLGILLSKYPSMKKESVRAFPTIFQPSISFREVSFSYDNQPVLQKLTFELRPRETLGILGQSGAGKSSIANLILGLISPQSGSIHIGNHPIQSLDLVQLRRHIAIVPQDVLLLNDTIMHNITLGAADVKKRDVQQAAILAGIHDSICKMPQGYNSYVGERGSKLSGGERKRIGIARALIKQAHICIFDEPTTFLDAQSAAYVRKTIQKMSTSKTCIVISHDLADLNGADQILTL